ncbi:MAG: DUF418 domain-containing protein [Ilumatobacteraceae bacterium]
MTGAATVTRTDADTRTGRRSIELDVVRAVALIGVCVMNYHGYLNARSAAGDESFMGALFDPWHGPLATRFAATFVTVAGMGVVLMTRRAVEAGDRAAIAEARWRLVRRGVLLLGVGYVFDWIWPGTILFFYGGFFLVSSLLFALRTRWIVTVGVVSAVAGAALSWWSTRHGLAWLLRGSSTATRSPRDLVFDLAVRGTHPLLPWLALLCTGMVLARHLPERADRRVFVAFAGVLAVLVGYGLRSVLPLSPTLVSTEPGTRGLLYTLTAIGSSVAAVIAIGAAARATAGSTVTRALAVAGRCTLSLYVLHALVFRVVVDTVGWVHYDSGLTTVLLMAADYWLAAVLLSAWWSRVAAIGPLEWLYRRFSDPAPPRLWSQPAE